MESKLEGDVQISTESYDCNISQYSLSCLPESYADTVSTLHVKLQKFIVSFLLVAMHIRSDK